MKIWIINPFDNLPVEGYRPQRYWLMAEAFAAAGHDVTLWTSDFSHANKAYRNFSTQEKNKAKADLGGDIVYVHAPPYKKNISGARIFSHWMLAQNWRKLAETKEAPDLVIVSSPPLTLTAQVRKYCQSHNIQYIVDVQDAWPETFERIVPSFLLKPLQRVAQRNYVGATAITTVAEHYSQIVKSYGVRSRIGKFYLGIGKKTCYAAPQNRTPHLSIVYAGNLGASYDLETVVKLVANNPQYSLDIAGAGPKETSLKKLATGCDRIKFHGYLKENELNELLSQCNCGIIPIFKNSHIALPGKFADYVAAGLPVLNSLDGETKDIVDKYGVGCNYTAGDVSSLSAAIEKLRGSIKTMRANTGKLFEKFNAENIYPAYVSFVEEVGSKRVEAPKEKKSPSNGWGVWPALGFCLLYALTAQRGVSWGEAGLFQFRILTHDIEGIGGLALAHPLYVMAGSLVSQFVPEQFLFWSLNFFSGLWMALTLAVFHKLVYEITDSVKASSLAVLTLGFSHMAWFSSTMSEVYTMSLFFIALETLSLVKFLKAGTWGYLLPLAFFNGLGLSVHNFSLLAWPVYAIAITGKFIAEKDKAVRLKNLGVCVAGLLLWCMGFMPLLVLAVKSYLASGDAVAVFKSLLFGDYASFVAGTSRINLKTVAFNYMIASLSFILPGMLLFFRKFKPKTAQEKALLGLFLIHFVFWARYFVPDQATFLLPTLFFAVLIASVSMAHVKNVKAFTVVTILLAVAAPIAASSLGRYVLKSSERRPLPFRDDAEYFIQPWKAWEKSAENFVFKVTVEANGNSKIYADITPMTPLACAKKMKWLPLGIQLHDPYFNGSTPIKRKGEHCFEVRPFHPYRHSPPDWKIEKTAGENILYRCSPPEQ